MKGGKSLRWNVLEVLARFGFPRLAEANYLPRPDEYLVSPEMIAEYALRTAGTRS